MAGLKTYFNYWGKADEPLKAAYCLGKQEKKAIVAQFKAQLARNLKLAESQIMECHLDEWAGKVDKKVGKTKWVYQQENYAPYHLLPFHCLDVAAVAAQWWKNSPALRQQFTQATLLETEDKAYAWLVFFICLHDLGKLDIRFQMKSSAAIGQLQPENYTLIKVTFDYKGSYDHGSNGYGWFESEFIDYGFNEFIETESMDWMQQVAGHHGRIPDNQSLIRPSTSEEIKQQDQQARIEWVQTLEQVFLKPLGMQLSNVPENIPTMLAGFCSVCDWIGSSTEYFPYQATIETDLQAYFDSRLPLAAKALNAFGLLAKVKGQSGMAALFPNYTPRGLQTLVGQFPLAQGLTLIEAPTGSGKTETALAYAAKLLTSEPCFGDGIIFALPTQATANAMLKRLQAVADKLFEGGANVVLAHGKSKLNPDFEKILANNRLTAQGAEEAGVQCSEWLGASKKRAFLGQIGVCTIDQVLLSVLPVRHQFVRGFGIQKSILIVDEVHAYDAYMYGLLTKVLERQKQAAGSVILLSATLPHQQKAKLLQSWGVASEQQSPAYPLVTHASDKHVFPFPLPESEQIAERIVSVETWQADQLILTTEQLQKIAQAAEQGAKVAVICNLVADAQHIAKQLAELTKIPVDLFHSRFRFIDRQHIEQDISGYYGKDETQRAAGGRILVATQVVEQSLDLDFDWMLTQLCPVDLLFQRLGRLHRHPRSRPTGFEQPRCVVIVPTIEAVYGDSRYVYQNLRALWRTEQLLTNQEIIFKSNQEDLKTYTAYRDWIESVYLEKAWGDEPEKIEKAYEEFDKEQEGKHYTAKTMMNSQTTPVSDEDDRVSMLTRDGEMSLTVVPVIKIDSNLATLEGLLLNTLADWQYWEVLNWHSLGTRQSWKSCLPKPDKDGIYFLPMQLIDQENGQYVSENGLLTYSKTKGLEKIKA